MTYTGKVHYMFVIYINMIHCIYIHDGYVELHKIIITRPWFFILCKGCYIRNYQERYYDKLVYYVDYVISYIV